MGGQKVKYAPVEGMLCCSSAGRDRKRYLLIVKVIDSEYVYVADGDIRRIENPKKKKLKHLRLTPKTDAALQEKLLKGMIVTDSDIRKAIAVLTEKGDGITEEQ